jgi:RNA polymerase sigma-70 factor (ECF subfamily)
MYMARMSSMPAAFFPIFWTSSTDGDEAVLPRSAMFAAEAGEGKGSDPIAALYDEMRPSLYSYLVCSGADPAEADDIIQETFLRLVRHVSGGRNTDGVRAWIYKVAHNLSINRWRQDLRLVSDLTADAARSLETRSHPGPTPEALVLRKEQMARLERAVGRLTQNQRRCLHLRAEGLRYREIAYVLGINVSTVGQTLERALVRLSEALDE